MRPTILKLSFVNRLPTIEATLQGKALRLVVDIGGYKALAIKPEVLAGLDVDYSGAVESWRDARGNVESARLFNVSSIQSNQTELVGLDAMELTTTWKFSDHDGFLGFGYLSRHIVAFDYPASEVRLYPRSATGGLPAECKGATFKFEITNGVVEVPVDTETGRLYFQVDTGSNMSLVHPNSLHEGVLVRQSGAHFSKFDIGDFKQVNVRLPVQDFVAPAVDGVLGSSFFEGRLVCMDFDSGSASIEKV